MYNRSRTFTKDLLSKLSPLRKELLRASGARPSLTHSPAESFRSPYFEALVEPWSEPERFPEYPALPDPYELPPLKAWFDDFHAPKTPEPFASPRMREVTAPVGLGVSLGEADELAEFEFRGFAPADGPQGEPPGGMLEVIQAIEQIQTGGTAPSWSPDEPTALDGAAGLEGQVQPASTYHQLGSGLEHMVNQPPDTMLAPEAPPPGIPLWQME